MKNRRGLVLTGLLLFAAGLGVYATSLTIPAATHPVVPLDVFGLGLAVTGAIVVIADLIPTIVGAAGFARTRASTLPRWVVPGFVIALGSCAGALYLVVPSSAGPLHLLVGAISVAFFVSFVALFALRGYRVPWSAAVSMLAIALGALLVFAVSLPPAASPPPPTASPTPTACPPTQLVAGAAGKRFQISLADECVAFARGALVDGRAGVARAVAGPASLDLTVVDGELDTGTSEFIRMLFCGYVSESAQRGQTLTAIEPLAVWSTCVVTAAPGSPGPVASPTPSTSATPTASSCPDSDFLGWSEILDRNASGSYEVALEPCELLWFNSGSVLFGGQRLGGDVAERNAVVLYRATRPTQVQIAIGSPQDLGHEWLATTSAGFNSTIASWAPQAMVGSNCGSGCTQLDFYEFVDGVPFGHVVVPPSARPTDSPTASCASGAAHAARLGALASAYGSGPNDWQAWLQAAGVTWDSIKRTSIPVQTELVGGQSVPSGVQVDGERVDVRWPNVVTAGDSRLITMLDNSFHVPETDVYSGVVLNGVGTVWVDGTNWGQLVDHFGCPNDDP
jgi:hypothetical protein